MRTMSRNDFESIPEMQQTQAALDDQLHDLMDVANRLGMCDAADYLRNKLYRRPTWTEIVAGIKPMLNEAERQER